jgi:hypothetical protein
MAREAIMRWIPGRQSSGYDKLPLFVSTRLKCDLYLLRFREGSFIDWHQDPVPGRRHYRANWFLRHARRGGHFECEGAPLVDWPFLQVFRPDLPRHRVGEVLEGTRYVLSFGWALPER